MMKRHLFGYSLATIATIAVLWLVPMSAAQPGAPNAAAALGWERGGQAPNAGANVPTPRTADGKPDLSGRWGGGADDSTVDVRDPDTGKQTEFASYEAYLDALGKGQVNPKAIVVGRQTNYRHGNNDYSGKDAALQRRFTGNPPMYKPEHWERVQYLDAHGNTEDTSFSCLPGGLPRMGPPTRILQTPTDFVFLYNTNAFLNVFDWRVVPADGRPHHPVYSKDQTFMGDSVAHWEGETLVIDVVGFNDLTWLGFPGWFHTADMRVVEKFRREGNQLHYDVTVYDPAVLLEPWQMEHRVLRLNPNTTYTEDPPCIEADSSHIVSRIR